MADRQSKELPQVSWAAALPEDVLQLEVTEKVLLVLSLISFLGFTLRDLIINCFTSTSEAIKRRAGAALRVQLQDNSTLPALLLPLWYNRFPSCREHLQGAVLEHAKRICVAESDVAIKNPKFHLDTSNCTVQKLYDTLDPSNFFSLVKDDMPFTVELLVSTTAAPNAYRRDKATREATAARKEEEEGREKDGGLDDPEDLDQEETVEDILGDVVADEGWREKYRMTRNPETVIMFILMTLLYVRNRSTNAFPTAMGLFMRTNGASARLLDTFHRAGVSISRRGIERVRETVSESALRRAINFMRHSGRQFYFIFDNINIFVRKAQQRLGNQNSMINATNAAVIGLPASIAQGAFDLAARLSMRGKRVGISSKVIRPTAENDAHMHKAFRAQVAELLVSYLPGAKQWSDLKKIKEKGAEMMPHIRPLPAEKTMTFPLGALDVNEGSLKGVIEVLNELRKRCCFTKKLWAAVVRIMAGDWLTSRNLRSARYLRQDDVNDRLRLSYMQELSQLFHFSINAVHMNIRTHLGLMTANPTSLSRFKDMLRRSFDVNKPKYAEGKELIKTSLIARLINIVQTKKGFNNYQGFQKWDPSCEEFEGLVDSIVTEFATSEAAAKAKEVNDDVLASSILQIRDALFFMEFESAVHWGDAGRVLEVLRYWAFCFRGCGLYNYSRECMEILVLWSCELPLELRAALEASWFVNRFGKEGRFIAADLWLEQQNYWLKKVFIPEGSGVTIQNIIKKGSAAIEALREMSYRVTTLFDTTDHRRSHKESKLEFDVKVLADEMCVERVHILTPDRPVFAPPPKKVKSVKAVKQRSGIVDVFLNGAQMMGAGAWSEFRNATTYYPEKGWPLGFQEKVSVTAQAINAVTVHGEDSILRSGTIVDQLEPPFVVFDEVDLEDDMLEDMGSEV